MPIKSRNITLFLWIVKTPIILKNPAPEGEDSSTRNEVNLQFDSLAMRAQKYHLQSLGVVPYNLLDIDFKRNRIWQTVDGDLSSRFVKPHPLRTF